MNSIPRLVAVFAALGLAHLGAADSRSLFDGQSTAGWRAWLGAPHASTTVEGLARGADGKYTEVLGWDRDPLGVFSVAQVDGRPALHFSGQVFGLLATTESFSNFHLRLQFKWGEKRWAPRAEAVRDSGLLYGVNGEPGRSSGVWPACLELQIQEHDCGDLYSIISQVDVLARTHTDAASNRTLYTYDPAGALTVFEQKAPIGNRCIKGGDFEKLTGEWNTIELIVLGADSIHIVNGHVVMRLRNARQQSGGTWVALNSGQIALQSEGAEVFYRDIELRDITEIPAEFAW